MTAAIAVAETGAPVRLYEAHQTLGGRGRATAPAHVAHDGAHVFYADGPHCAWLKQRGFVSDLGWPRLGDWARAGFRVGGRGRSLPPVRMLRAQARGRLSAAFVWELFQCVFGANVPAVRWVRGGWQRVIDQMAAHAIELGVVIEAGARIDRLPTGGPVIIATDLNAAGTLLDDDSLHWTSGHCALLDIAVTASRGDRTLVFDLDEGGFHESYTMQDDTIAPPGEWLFQLQMPTRTGESASMTLTRLKLFADTVVPGWRDRTTFQRSATAKGRTGALDLPGQTWRDRTAKTDA